MFSPKGKTNEQLALDVKNKIDENESLKELDSRLCGIFYSLIRKYSYALIKQTGSHAIKDCDNQRLFVLLNAIDSYKNKSKFSSWFYLTSTFFFKQKMYKFEREEKNSAKLKNFIVVDSEVNVDGFNNRLEDVFDILESYPDPRAKNIFKERYCSSKRVLSYRDVAKSLKNTVSYEKARQIHDEALDFLKKKTHQV